MPTPTQETRVWSARFGEGIDKLVSHCIASIPFDWRLARFDTRASLAHARMLIRCGTITTEDVLATESGLNRIAREVDAGTFEWSIELECLHFKLERCPKARIGDAAAMRLATERGHSSATDLTDQLARNEVPFLAAHEVVARAERMAEDSLVDLSQLTQDEVIGAPMEVLGKGKGYAQQILGDDLKHALSIEASLSSRCHVDETAPPRVRRAATIALAPLESASES